MTELEKDIYELKEIVVDDRARDGTWCRLPYPSHPRGCPNYPECIEAKMPIREIIRMDDSYRTTTKWYAIIQKFDLKAHAEKMKNEHQDWSERQCRCLLYWQGHLRKELEDKTMRYREHMKGVDGNYVFTIPEAHGINIFKTMENVGVILRKNPDTVIKVMLLGVRGGLLSKWRQSKNSTPNIVTTTIGKKSEGMKDWRF